MFQVNSLMKNEALFSSKDKSKKLKCCLLQFLFGDLRVNLPIFIRALLWQGGGESKISRHILAPYTLSKEVFQPGQRLVSPVVNYDLFCHTDLLSMSYLVHFGFTGKGNFSHIQKLQYTSAQNTV